MKLLCALGITMIGLSGCGTTGCALQAFGAGVNGRPQPACVAEMKSVKALTPVATPAVLHCWRDTSGQNMYCE